VARRQFGSQLKFETELLVGCQRLQRTADGLGNVLNAVIRQFEFEAEITKVLRCSDLMHGCDYVARADSEDELMQKAAQHGREKHGMQRVPPEVAQKIKSKIRDE